MSTKSEKDKQKQIQDKCQALLNTMLRDEDNKYCVDCDSKGPRWASWNLGVFLCIRCAGIHRNLGVHISKVKSVNLDSWTPEQVVSLQQMGNSRARAVYEANLPDNFRRPQSDTSLESFIRAKYEHKKYIAREWVPPVIPKVDWEKDIDEEIERQKRKKKTTVAVDKKTIKITEVPQIPKPKSSASPKAARTNVPIEKTTQDLLGLQNGEDGFSGFLSATTKEETKKDDASVDAAKAEEESFFNQPAPTEKEKSRMTKDSILALYGNAPPQPVYNPAFQCGPAPVYAQNYQYPTQPFVPPQQQFVTAPVAPQPYSLQNGSTPFQSIQQNQFAPVGMPYATPQQYVNPTPFAPVQQQQYQYPAYTGIQQPVAPANPFGMPNTTTLPQQFAGMSLSAAPMGPKPAQAPQAANLWQ